MQTQIHSLGPLELRNQLPEPPQRVRVDPPRPASFVLPSRLGIDLGLLVLARSFTCTCTCTCTLAGTLALGLAGADDIPFDSVLTNLITARCECRSRCRIRKLRTDTQYVTPSRRRLVEAFRKRVGGCGREEAVGWEEVFVYPRVACAVEGSSAGSIQWHDATRNRGIEFRKDPEEGRMTEEHKERMRG
jgi:hypothetical protein